MIDLKKLIGGFLVLAAIMSSAGLIFLDWQNNQTLTQQANISNQSQNYANLVPGNAFTDQYAVAPQITDNQTVNSAGSVAIKASDLPPAETTGNLTHDFADSFARQIVLANPSGPQQTADGQTSLNMPDQTSLLNQLTGAPEIQTLQAPDWIAEAKALTVNISDDNSVAAKERYITELDNIFNQYTTNQVITAFLEKDPTTANPSELQPVAETLAKAASSTQSITIPSTLVGFHKSLLAAIVYEKNFADMGVNVETTDDPVKTYLIAQAEKNVLPTVASDLQTEFEKAGLQKSLSVHQETKTGVLAFINQLIGVKTAYADYTGPIRLGTQISSLINDIVTNIWKIIEQALILVLRTQLVNTIQQAMVKYVQGSGAPKFITNWLNYQAKAFDTAAAQSLTMSVARGDPSFSGLVGKMLNLTALNATPKSDLRLVLTDANAFYGDFSRGGWNGFGAMLRPNNNFFGFLSLAHDKQLSDAAAALNSQVNRAVAGQGFPGTDTGGGISSGGDCLPYSASYDVNDITGQSQTDAVNTITANVNNEIQAGYTQTQLTTCTNGTCSAEVCKTPSLSKQLITTPGATIGNKLSSALGGDIHLSANANAVAGFLASFINGLIGKFTGGSLLNL
ncbi:MAG: hypothetical protein KGJ89_01360 [Patescibacteria group bacterium]|nr:hypothetical protein [Patescibacteria group bacterium]MDE2015160.1 hypothetical protein [Patescibacteria group bacterium]MDE2226588.1 hypothetical protein [Patescibacteria group bacterium]